MAQTNFESQQEMGSPSCQLNNDITSLNQDIVKQESFDIDNLNKLLRHQGISQDEKKLLSKMLKNRIDGNKLKVEYDFGSDAKTKQIGRLYSKIGLQGLPRNIRSNLAQKYYWDLDIINAHPTILLHIAKENQWVCSNLENYVNNREDVLKEITKHYDCSRDQAKDLMLVILYLPSSLMLAQRFQLLKNFLPPHSYLSSWIKSIF